MCVDQLGFLTVGMPVQKEGGQTLSFSTLLAKPPLV